MAAVSIGIAKPRPSTPVPEDLATTRPIICPEPLKSPPPEFPGLTEASVCISFICWFSTVTVLDVELMIPAETLSPSSPRGLPTTTAISPTDTELVLPISAAVRFFAFILSTATSFEASVPII